MQKYKCKFRPGFTMIELSLAAIALVVMILGVGMIFVDSQNSWNKMYTRLNGNVVSGAYVAKNTFDSIVRRASISSLSIDSEGAWINVSYSSNPGSGTIDRYALFYSEGGKFKVQYGQFNPDQILRTQTICSNVTSCKFSQSGTSVQMALALTQNSQSLTVMSSAYLHN
jgi:hypothetical protein